MDKGHWGTCTVLSMRSEEHTSELQSRLHLVCRLLLEKKKKSPCESSSSTPNPPSTYAPLDKHIALYYYADVTDIIRVHHCSRSLHIVCDCTSILICP